jgi:hypothetical protein
MTKHHHKREQWEGELVNRQRNIVFPDTVRNGRSVDALLWRGDPHATRVQRIGIAVFAATYLLLGALFIYMGWHGDPQDSALKLVGLLFAAPLIYVGVRLLKNTFLRLPSKSDQQ